jgi:hypothetical protein
MKCYWQGKWKSEKSLVAPLPSDRGCCGDNSCSSAVCTSSVSQHTSLCSDWRMWPLLRTRQRNLELTRVGSVFYLVCHVTPVGREVQPCKSKNSSQSELIAARPCIVLYKIWRLNSTEISDFESYFYPWYGDRIFLRNFDNRRDHTLSNADHGMNLRTFLSTYLPLVQFSVLLFLYFSCF